MTMPLSIDSILQHPVEPIAIINSKTLKLIRCNKNFEDYFSINSTEQIGRDIYDVISCTVPREKKALITESLSTTGLYIDQDSSEENHIFISTIEVEGNEYGFLRISNQRKYTQFEQYRQLFEQNQAGVYKADIDGNILSCNEAFATILGYKGAKDLIGVNTQELYREPRLRQDFLKKIREKKVLKNYEIQVIRKDGETATCLESCYLEKLASGNETISGTIIDFTEKKRIESDLAERENWFRTLSDVSQEGVVFELAGIIVECNSIFGKLFGFETSLEIIGCKLSDFIDERELRRVKSNVNISADNKTEIRIHRNDRPLFLEVTGSYIVYKGERTLALVVNDVTERKKAELALERGVVRFRNLLENLPNGVIILTDSRIKYLNHAACTLLGADEEDEVYDEPFLQFIHEGYRSQVEQDLNDVRQGLDVDYMELKIASVKDELIDVGIKLVLTVYENRPSIQVTLNNVSMRIQLAQEQMRMRLVEELNTVLKQRIEMHEATQKELELQQRETNEQKAKLEAIFNSTENLMMWTVDKSGEITAHNKNFRFWVADFFKIDINSGDNMISFLESRLDPDLYQGQLKSFQNAFKGRPQQIELPLRNKQGTSIWLQVFLNPVYVEDVFNELSCLAYDNTERKEFEKSVRHSLKEKEVLLQEVHHRVKNNLQIISSMLNLQSNHVTDQGTLDVLRESQQRINSMSLIHETIYRNSDFSEIDFSEYIRAIVSNLIQSYRNPETEVELITELEDVTIGLDQSIPCGLIVNELVSNAMKYAFVGRKKGRLHIKINQKKGNKIALTIQDDGVGLPSSLNVKNANSLGLTLVNALTEQLDGKMVMKNQNGTSHTLNFTKK